MNHPDQNAPTNHPISGSAPSPGTVEATLRLIATLPAPEGLDRRVQTGLRSHVRSGRRQAHVLSWPAAKPAGNHWMRSAAAAAIVFVVAGGGWGIYSRVQKPESAKVIVLPHAQTPGEFTNAGAIRTPKTLNGPVVAHSASQPASASAPMKAAVEPAQPQNTKLQAVSKAKLQPAERQAK
jgi:hypothetical protein